MRVVGTRGPLATARESIRVAGTGRSLDAVGVGDGTCVAGAPPDPADERRLLRRMLVV